MQLINDIHLLKVFSYKETYRKYISYIHTQFLDHHIKVLLQDFEEYYNLFEKDIEDISEFYTWFIQARHPNLPEAAQIIYKTMLDNLQSTETTIAEQILKEYQKKHLINELTKHFELGLDVEFVQDKLKAYISSISTLSQDSEDEDLVQYDIDDLLKGVDKNTGLKWRLNILNDTIGSIKTGYLIIIAAFVDIGKTSCAISEATYMAQQLTDGCVLWLNNEEEDLRVIRKIWKSTLNCTDEDLIAHPEKAKERFIQRMNGDKDRIKLINIRKKTIKGIKSLFEKYNPKLVVIDQADKIMNPNHKAFTDHGQLKNIYGEIRSLANTYCPVIAISQADSTTMYKPRDSEDYKYTLYPHHRQLDGSKVGKPGEADAIIMIGRRAENNNTRGLHVSKNKFGDSNNKQEVLFDGARCRYNNPE